MPRKEWETGIDSLADVVERLGDVPLYRIRVQPPIGTATEQDIVDADDPLAKLLELVDGVLVEKAVSTAGSAVGVDIACCLMNHIKEEDTGVVLGEACPFLLKPGLVRKPSAAYVPWERIPGGKIDMEEYYARYAPDLVVELKTDDTPPAEIDRRLREYFEAGVRLAWVVDLREQTARSYTAPDEFNRVGKTGYLRADPVLPGLRIALPEVFACLRRRKKTG